jgi:PAS domain S-box-containing protein
VKKGAEKKADSLSLRSRAEKQLERVPETVMTRRDADQKRLIHELRVHQIELEMQNEALRNAQHEIEESRAKYMDLYDFAPVGYLTFDETGVILELNLAVARFLGMERGHLVNKPLSFFIEPQFRDIFYLHRQGVLASCAKQACELMFKRKDGTLFHAQLESVAAETDGRRIIRAAFTDITERKQAEEALRKSEEWLRQFFASIPDYCYLVSPEGKVIDANNATLEGLGYTREELIGQSVEMLYAPRSRELRKQLFNRWLETGVLRNEEMTILTKEGGERTVLLNVGSMRNKDGTLIHSTSVQTDITELKKSEEVRKRLEEDLRQSQKMEAIGTLAGGVAHDFNNMLASILGFTEMAIEDIPDHPLVQRILQNVLKSADRARDLVNQILVFSRKGDYVRQPLSLAPIIRETVRFLRASVPAVIHIAVHTTTIYDTVLADAVEIQQIVMNLCTNAAHAMQRDGGKLTIVVSDADSGFAPGEYVQITVKDTGEGMDPEVTKRIFEPFFTTKEVGQGTGMGLAVVYGIVKTLNGHITVESEPAMGSVFRVFLPKSTENAAPEAAKAVEEIPRGKERILFVDDEELLAQLGKEMLERLGYTVTAMSDSVKALKHFSRNPSRFDLVFTDQVMPTMNGLTLAKELLKLRKDIPIILCTGHHGPVPVVDKAKKAGIRECLTKPLTTREIARAIRRVLDWTNV